MPRSTPFVSPRVPSPKTTWAAGRPLVAVARWRTPWRISRGAWPGASTPRPGDAARKMVVEDGLMMFNGDRMGI